MTMFKTKEQIEVLSGKYAKNKKPQNTFEYELSASKIDYREGYTQAQKDLLESTSKSFNDWLWSVNFGGTTQTEISRMGFAWEMAKLSSMKELQEKDERIKELERKIKSIDCYIAADEKYQEAIKDIEWLLTDCDQDLYTHLDKIDEIKAKYGLNKQESKE